MLSLNGGLIKSDLITYIETFLYVSVVSQGPYNNLELFMQTLNVAAIHFARLSFYPIKCFHGTPFLTFLGTKYLHDQI